MVRSMAHSRRFLKTFKLESLSFSVKQSEIWVRDYSGINQFVAVLVFKTIFLS